MKKGAGSSLTKGIQAFLPLLWSASGKFIRDHGFFLASGIAFGLLLCIIPLILVLLYLAGTYLYTEREVLNVLRRYLETLFPSQDPGFMSNILSVIRDRKIVGIVGVAGLLWTSTFVFSALRTALGVVFEIPKGRGFVHGKAVDIVMVLLAGGLFILSVFLSSGVTFLRGGPLSTLLGVGWVVRFLLRYVIPLLFTFWMFFVIYKVVPYRPVRSGTAFQAALFATLFWDAVKHLFGWYVLHLGRFSMIYGSLGTLAVLFFWVYYSSAILLLGGEIAFQLEKGKPRKDR
jgi:membrane protein